jgi:hypothetical protein
MQGRWRGFRTIRVITEGHVLLETALCLRSPVFRFYQFAAMTVDHATRKVFLNSWQNLGEVLVGVSKHFAGSYGLLS